MTYRVIQWATGGVGQAALQGILVSPKGWQIEGTPQSLKVDLPLGPASAGGTRRDRCVFLDRARRR